MRTCRVEKVGVTGEVMSELDELIALKPYDHWGAVFASGLETWEPESCILRSSTNWGSNKGFNFGDMPRSIEAVASTACEWVETAFVEES